VHFGLVLQYLVERGEVIAVVMNACPAVVLAEPEMAARRQETPTAKEQPVDVSGLFESLARHCGRGAPGFEGDGEGWRALPEALQRLVSARNGDDRQLAEKVRKMVRSPEGRKAVNALIDQANANLAELRKRRERQQPECAPARPVREHQPLSNKDKGWER
jgi:hypothetical protein